jgi:hypothetical protein
MRHVIGKLRVFNKQACAACRISQLWIEDEKEIGESVNEERKDSDYI